jgi:hypothetical protein
MKAENLALVAQRLKKIEEFIEPLGGIFSGPVQIEQAGGSIFVNARLRFDLSDRSKCTGKSDRQEECSL